MTYMSSKEGGPAPFCRTYSIKVRGALTDLKVKIWCCANTIKTSFVTLNVSPPSAKRQMCNILSVLTGKKVVESLRCLRSSPKGAPPQNLTLELHLCGCLLPTPAMSKWRGVSLRGTETRPGGTQYSFGTIHDNSIQHSMFTSVLLPSGLNRYDK